ncbi:MAG: endonuclease III [Thaumarchaeota archaeon]|nr:endonuclease III [Nitrososphaerota archaeon]MCL5318034.1 endonuclease III [Nitrososphaerota archaeon]
MATVLSDIVKMLEQYTGFKTALGEVSAEWESDSFKVLIATILSQRTRDEVTEKAAERLFHQFGTPEELAEADEEEVKKLIRPVGFYPIKAKRIKEVAKLIIERFHGKVPHDMESLLSLPSVGRKTANCVLVYGFKEPAIPVDTHVHRISNRLNLVQTRTPEATEERLAETVDKKYWLNINDLFIRFGKKICLPIGPKCGICLLKDHCAYYAVKVAHHHRDQ